MHGRHICGAGWKEDRERIPVIPACSQAAAWQCSKKLTDIRSIGKKGNGDPLKNRPGSAMN